ncbi:tRNA uracil 4-sulfurtransferase ThiI [Aliicoccus persicus]|uniref:Probable tRNA sulfurtransferase n=1 Tax=Aliicoccus persicus TaxID=930138 RepID=A0A662Z1M6_9STAP|nr:tRNA uracil 4-sulfurtransferase ThiI [Aliicoccus persicus]SEV87203.1 thiamine biosynthesis protein ThiI [Aliicoccus persicus]
MKYNHILVRYGEITLKTRNRNMFINVLKRNIKNALAGTQAEIKTDYSSALIDLNDESYETVLERIRYISGILSVSPVLKIERDIEVIKETASNMASSFSDGKSFKIEVKRQDKTFEYDTGEIQQMVGSHVQMSNEHLHVNVKAPDHTIMIQVKVDRVYVYCEHEYLQGGLPYGTGGKALLLLSGGIDSPVAGLEVAKKGVEIEAIHFHSPPYTSKEATDKVKRLVDIMSERIGAKIKLHIYPFTDIQTTIYKKVPDNYSMTSTRRLMLSIAERLAIRTGSLAIVNGENLGQVASQTLSSMHVINEVTNYPILRPLLSHEKMEIVELANKYGTFETSILPFEDCCTIFKPKNPKINPRLDKTLHFEDKIDFEPLIEEGFKNIIVYESHEKEEESFEDIL